MDISGWRLLKAGHSRLTQHKVHFSLTFQVLWCWLNLPSTSSHPCPPPANNRSDKILYWATSPLPFLQTVFSSPSPASRHSFTPCWFVPLASLQLSGPGRDCWGTHSPPQCPSCSADTHSWKQAVTVSLCLCSLPVSCFPSSAVICLIGKARQFRICTRSCPFYSPAEAN